MRRKKAVIIGGGIAGLSGSALLAKQGYDVTVLEKNESFGGRARTLKQNGFQFDRGPSWYMMPEVFEDFFALFGKKPSDFYTLTRLDPSYKIFFEHDEPLVISSDLQKTTALFESIERGAGQAFSEYITHAKVLYEIVTKKLLYENLAQPNSLLSLKHVPDLLRLASSPTLRFDWHTYVNARFTDHRLQKILTFPSVFLGGSPYITPALFSLLSWADFGKGILYPQGGMSTVINGLEELARCQGVRLETNQEVQRFSFSDDKIDSVHAQTSSYPADLVVAATDIAHVELSLLPEDKRMYPETYWKKKTFGISAILLYIGVPFRIPEAVHHTLYFSDDWKKNFSEIFDKGILPENPSFYVSIRSATDRSIVPKGADELFVLIPVPATVEIDHRMYEEVAQKVRSTIESILNISLDQPTVSLLTTPNDFADMYNAYNGTALGIAHTFSQSFFTRPTNHHQRVRNLFYSGQYTYPGIGMPMAIASSRIMVNAVSTYDKATHF